ncbi:MAG: hypothetical protein IJY81_02870 [Lachnospiraceae bacterium]|nr:hypothetical protein [Lachnospiraceae bacterium]
MILRNLSLKEKIAIVKSLISIAGEDAHLSPSEGRYLGMLLLKMGEDGSFWNHIDDVSNDEAIRILRNLSYDDKQDLVYLWVEMAIKSRGDMFGVFSINNLSDGKNTIISLARTCNIDIDIHKEYTYYNF